MKKNKKELLKELNSLVVELLEKKVNVNWVGKVRCMIYQLENNKYINNELYYSTIANIDLIKSMLEIEVIK